jgi:capsular polysaccharide biosynthesis protein
VLPWSSGKDKPLKSLRRILNRQLERVRRRVSHRIRAEATPPQVTQIEKALIPLRSLLPARKTRTVVILVAAPTQESDQLASTLFASDQVHVITAAARPQGTAPYRELTASDLAEVESALREIGPIDVILHLDRPFLGQHRHTFSRLFFHQRRGGVYIVDRRSVTNEPDWSDFVDSLGKVTRIYREPSIGSLAALEQELAYSIEQVVIGRKLIAVTKRVTHQLKLRNSEAEELLAKRRGVKPMHILGRRSGGSFSSLAVLHHYGEPCTYVGFDETIPYPEVIVRSYQGKIGLVSHSLLYTDHVVLPDSFRYYLNPRLTNDRLIDVNEDFARIPCSELPSDLLPGSYYHLDSPWTGHFGHLMTEVLSRLWGWDEAKAACPDLKAIYRAINPQRSAFQRQVLEAYGIEPDDIVGIDRPIFLKSVFGATPMWHHGQPHSVHPEISAIWDRLGAHLVDPEAKTPPYVFVSRPPNLTNRPCTNVPQVEQYFSERGFTIVYPELHTLSAQATLFAGAKVVAGFAGSGLFNVMFSKELRSLIILSHDAYTARNEYMFASVLGCQVHYLWSAADMQHPKSGWSAKAYQSTWTFDFDRHKDTLRELTSHHDA